VWLPQVLEFQWISDDLLFARSPLRRKMTECLTVAWATRNTADQKHRQPESRAVTAILAFDRSLAPAIDGEQ
jgi:hypothetical protein